MAGVDRHPELRLVPLVRPAQETADLGVDEADADAQLPALAVALEAAGHHDLDELPDVLPETAHPVVGQPPRREERLADEGGEAADDARAHQRLDVEIRIGVERPAPGVHRPRIEPVRYLRTGFEKPPEFGGRVAEAGRVLVHPGGDELVDPLLRHAGHGLDRGLRERVPDHGVLAVAIRQLWIRPARRLVARPVRGGDLESHRQESLRAHRDHGSARRTGSRRVKRAVGAAAFPSATPVSRRPARSHRAGTNQRRDVQG